MSHIRRLIPRQYRHRVFTVIFLFTLLPYLLFCSLYVKKTFDDSVRSVLDNNGGQLKSSVEQINLLLTQAQLHAEYIVGNTQVTTFFRAGFVDDMIVNMTFNERLRDIVQALNASQQGVDITIYMYNSSYYNGIYMLNMERLLNSVPDTQSGLRERLLNLKGREAFWVYRKAELTGNQWNAGDEYLCYYRPLMGLNNVLALVEVRVSFDRIRQILSFDRPENSFIMYGAGNRLSVDVLGGANARDGPPADGGYYVLSERILSASDAVNMYIPRESILRGAQSVITTSIVTFALLLLLMALLDAYVTRHLTDRFNNLMKEINTNVENILESDASMAADDDMGRASAQVYELIDRVKKYYTMLSEYEAEKTRFQLELLQSRINPHFLYNTLSSIKWLCNNAELERIIDAMVDFYRLSLSGGGTMQKIFDEARMIDKYLTIQKFAFASDFTYTIDIDGDAGQHMIIKHLLQPIVENAVLHGINGLETGGVLTIKGRVAERGALLFQIADNGVGMPEEKVKEITECDGEKRGGGYGLRNVQKRIQLLYGGGYGITIQSAPGRGTTVLLTLPAVRE